MSKNVFRQLGRVANRVMRQVDRFCTPLPTWHSAADKAALQLFDTVSLEYAAAYESLLRFKAPSKQQTQDGSSYPWPRWEQQLAQEFSKRVPRAFLEHPTIKETMVFHGRIYNSRRFACVRRMFGETASRALVSEDPIGEPRLCSPHLRTSSNRLYHAFHLAMYQQHAGRAFARDGMVVEWGGGYGDMMRLLSRLTASFESHTAVIIDLPAVGALQWTYLTAILGRDAVRIVDHPEQEIKKNRINIMNSAVAFAHPDLRPQCFISTWALTESPHFMQDEVVARNFFDASNVLLAFSMDADNRVAPSLLASGGFTTPVPFMCLEGYAPSSYGFR